MSLQPVLDVIGLSNVRTQRVSGGDINRCWRLKSGEADYFLKINNSRAFPGMFRLEAMGLDELRNHSDFTIPALIREGQAGDDQFLLIEWLEQVPGNHDQNKAGNMLAKLHSKQEEKFGWQEDNYIGSLKQINTWHNNWHSFYSECRINPFVKLLFDRKNIPKTTLSAAEKFCHSLSEIYPSERASLLHGDLWSGNYMNTSKGPSLFDPAVYYGHREMDIGMTRLFGGFSDEFYAGYESIFPLEKGWISRIPFSQLYPLLVHAVLFGGSYIQRCLSILKIFQ